MRVIFNEKNDYTLDKPVAIALGTFDGIHKGHQALIQRLKQIKCRYNCVAMVYTFKQHPISCLSPDKTPQQIMNLNKKILEFHRLGVDILVLNNFDSTFARTSPREFVEKFLLQRYNVRHIIAGYNYRFGYQGSGDVRLLAQMGAERGFNVVVIPPFKLCGEVVSSSLIREQIQQGQVMKAACYLGRPYSINGKIIHGQARGRKLGYPTANLDIGSKNVVIPKFGVYLTRCNIDERCIWGVTNVGNNPTFNQGGLHIETHFLGYHGEDIYGKCVRINFLRYIRAERQFSSEKELSEQICRDIYTAKNLVYKMSKV